MLFNFRHVLIAHDLDFVIKWVAHAPSPLEECLPVFADKSRFPSAHIWAILEEDWQVPLGLSLLIYKMGMTPVPASQLLDGLNAII